MIKITATKDYLEIYNLALKYGAEPTEIPKVIEAWKAEESGKLIGGVMLVEVNGFNFLEWLSVMQDYRQKGIGARLVNEVINFCKSDKIANLFLCAKIPDYFEKFGFSKIEMSEIPREFSCLDCDKYQKDCFPSAMRLFLN